VHVEDYDSPTISEPLGDLTIDLVNFDFSQGKMLKLKDAKLDNVSKGRITLNVTYKSNQEKGMVGRLSVYTDALVGVKPDLSRRRSTDFRAPIHDLNERKSFERRKSTQPRSTPQSRSNSVIRPMVLPSQLLPTSDYITEENDSLHDLDDDGCIVRPGVLSSNSVEGSMSLREFPSIVENPNRSTNTKSRKQRYISKSIESQPSSKPTTAVRALKEAFSPVAEFETSLCEAESPRKSGARGTIVFTVNQNE